MGNTVITVLAAFFLLAGILTMFIAVFGVFKFDFIMNRMHCAAIIDALALSSILVGLLILTHSVTFAPKLLLILCFQWIGSPIASHMVGRLEVHTDDSLLDHMKLESLDEENTEEEQA